MMVYNRKVKYSGHTNEEYGLQIVTFNGDEGEEDSLLSLESIYTDNYNGTMRHEYGARYNSNAKLYITMVKNNYSDFSKNELREILKWLTGLRKSSWLDLYNDDSGQISFSFFGRITDVKLQKLDSRVIGIKAIFTSVSPWAYSEIKNYEIALNGVEVFETICNCSDEDSIYVYPKVVFYNRVSNGSLRILNVSTGEETLLKNLAQNEIVTIDSNKIIYSDNSAKIFGNDFNLNWPRFIPGYNYLHITGTGHLTIEHRDILKVAEAFDDNDQMTIFPTDKNVLLLTEITLLANNWTPKNIAPGDILTYTQVVNMNDITINSKIDLQPDEDQLLDLQRKGISLQIINNNGVITAYAYGDVPTIDYIMQATVEETDIEITHRYAKVFLYADAWQGNGEVYTQLVYIKGISSKSIIDLELNDMQIAQLDDTETTLMIKNDKGTTTAYAIGFKPDFDYFINVVITETTRDKNQITKLPIEEEPYAEPIYF